jgi:hypothetical protein
MKMKGYRPAAVCVTVPGTAHRHFARDYPCAPQTLRPQIWETSNRSRRRRTDFRTPVHF